MADQLSKRHAEAQVEERILRGPEFTAAGLCDRYGHEHMRLIDRTIQKLRKAGKITGRREGRTFVWKAASDA
jgi:hypothetical protein